MCEKRHVDAVGVVEPNVPVKELLDNDGWLAHSIIPFTWASYFSSTLWYIQCSSYGSGQQCKYAYRCYWENCIEQG